MLDLLLQRQLQMVARFLEMRSVIFMRKDGQKKPDIIFDPFAFKLKPLSLNDCFIPAPYLAEFISA